MYRINGIDFATKEAVDAFLLMATKVNAYGCTSLTELTAPNATEVYAYGCTSLTELTAPNATEVYASYCTSLTELTAPNATKVYARDCKSLSELSAPNATEVDASNCTSLTELTAPNATKVYASNCKSLSELTAPNATEVDAYGCTSLTNCNGFTQLIAEDCASNLKKVAELALASKDALEMSRVHACETTHCIAGWAVTNHPNGSEMEKKCGWWLAGKFLLGDEAASHFQDSQRNGLEYLKSINKE